MQGWCAVICDVQDSLQFLLFALLCCIVVITFILQAVTDRLKASGLKVRTYTLLTYIFILFTLGYLQLSVLMISAWFAHFVVASLTLI